MTKCKLSIRRPHGRTLGLACAAAAAVAVMAAPANAAVLEGSPVKASARQEVAPAVGYAPDGTVVWFAWAQTSRANSEAFTVYVETPEGTRRVSRPGTAGFPGSFEGGTLAYTEIGRRGSVDIRLYDAASGRHVAVPRGVNTRNAEWAPSQSGRRLAFARMLGDGRTEQVILYDAETGRQRVLARGKSREMVFQHVQTSGSKVVWTRCLSRCDVFVHDIETGATQRLAKPRAGQMQWGGAATPNGTVYLLRSGLGCGRNVKIVRYGAADPTTGTVLTSFPRGVDAFATAPVAHADGSVDVYYDRLVCRTSRWDIYKVADGAPAVAPAPAAPPGEGPQVVGPPAVAPPLEALRRG